MVQVAMVAIGGYGGTLAGHLIPIVEKGECRIVAAADTRLADLPKQAKTLREHGAELYTDAIEMLDAVKGECDAVFIATSIGSHAALTCAAAERGYHIHLEKPPAATIQEMDRMQQAVSEAGVICQVGFQATWSDELRFIEDRIAAGRLGRIESITVHAGWPRTREYYTRNNWAGRLKSGGNWVMDGPAMNALAHQVMNILLFASPEVGGYARPVSVRAELYAAGPVDSHDTAAIEIRTAKGPSLYFLGSHCSNERFGPIIEIRGEKGRATWRGFQETVISYDDGTQEQCEATRDAGRSSMVEGFLRALAGDDDSAVRCKLADARNFVLVLDGAHESSGRIHRIGEAFTRRVDADTDDARTVVEGLDELLVRGAESGALFSDLDGAPEWAVATEPFDLSDYRSFPQRFAVPD